MDLKTTRGLDIPLLGKPSGSLQQLPYPTTAALDLEPFYFLRFTLLKKLGDKVAIGEPLVEDKSCPGRVFVAPTSGIIQEIVRGYKRQVLRCTIACDQETRYFDHGSLKGEILPHLMKGGLFPHIIVRPCNRLPEPEKKPDAIFVKAIASAPYEPSPLLELEGHAPLFQKGLTALASIATVHLVTDPESPFLFFSDASIHTAKGPHPISHPSLHIAAIHPITNYTQAIWTLSVSDVIAVALLVSEGKYYHKQIISLAGEGILEKQRGFFRAFRGYSVRNLMCKRCDEEKNVRLLSGNPLTGSEVGFDGYLKFFDKTFCALPEPQSKRRFCHFLRLGTRSYTSMRAYKRKQSCEITTLQHGEERPFVDGGIYEKVMPLNVPVMHLIKAILAEDYELAEALGLLTVSPEDFALPAFICPSKIEMPEIIRRGIRSYVEQYLDS